MKDLENTTEAWMLSREPTETLMERLRAIEEGRYPTISHRGKILRILSERVPRGCIIVYDVVWLRGKR
tara:strand:- start:30 stop:233 length:204 start_codon:yes stop_codon:yes gene_type:complete